MTAKILCVAGARPNFMKIAPILRALQRYPNLTAKLVHTGQHYDAKLSHIFFEELGIPKPDFELAVGSGSHPTQTAEIMKRFEPVLEAEQPHAVIVVGDVNSTLACALVTAKFTRVETYRSQLGKRRIPILIHVEAGLRSFDTDMPEEINRKVTDSISDVLFVSEEAGMANLRLEGVPKERIHFVGNVMIDTLLAAREAAKQSTILEKLGLTPGTFGLVTLHRSSNVDDPRTLARLLDTLDEVAMDLPLLFPIHPRTKERLHASGVTLHSHRWIFCEPLGYMDFVQVMSSCRLVLTDSGGVQEETTVLGTPCLTLRENTERPATIHQGTNVLVGTERDNILSAFQSIIGSPPHGRVPELWDGRASERIATQVSALFTEP